MNNEQQQKIEEMAHNLCKSKKPCTECLKSLRDAGFFVNKTDCKCFKHATTLYNTFNRALEEQLQEARKKALDLAFILSEVIEKLNVCTLKLENKNQEFTDGYTEAIAEVRNSLKELLKMLE